jgi:DNA-binding ferritin-like protein
MDLSLVKDELNIPSPMTMFNKLLDDNMTVIEQLKKTQILAENENAVGLANFLQDRIDKHYKHDWMIRSITKV